jgi:hypothetical protein
MIIKLNETVFYLLITWNMKNIACTTSWRDYLFGYLKIFQGLIRANIII